MLLKHHFDQKVVLDTSVILHDALSLNAFPKTDIYIPFYVLEEIDRFKRDMGENGRNARQFNRYMDALRSKGALTEGVLIENGSYVFVSMPSTIEDNPLPSELDKTKIDNYILATALYLKRHFPKSSVELISKDINLRVKSDVCGVSARDYDSDRASSHGGMYQGVREIEVNKNELTEFFQNGSYVSESKLYSNEYLILKHGEETALGRFDRKQNKVVPLLQPALPVWRVHPRNSEQSFAFDALFNDDILFVSLLGKAGTGKTLLALAAGLHKTKDEGRYQRLLVSRPIFPLGRDIGYLPGDLEEKLNPWMQPVFDSLEFIMGMGKKASHMTKELMEQGLLSIEPLAYIRGRSIPRQYMIIDEAQNLTPHEVKTIITRAGLGAKVVLTGDCEQIDNPYIDASNSGLAYSVEKFKGEDVAAHVTLTKGERSPLAELAANLL